MPHSEHSAANVEPLLTSSVLTSPADGLLRDAIAKTLRAEPQVRAARFEQLLREIEDFMDQHPEERPWSCSTFTGSDGSRIFRGGTGRSIVIDPLGEMWRARRYEDFDTAYAITSTECRIASLTPHYEDMRRYELE